MKIVVLLFFLFFLGTSEVFAEQPFEVELQKFVGQNDKYIGRRFNNSFPTLYGRLVSICCLKEGGKRSEVRWYARGTGANMERTCRAIFWSQGGTITRVEVQGEGCGR